LKSILRIGEHYDFGEAYRIRFDRSRSHAHSYDYKGSNNWFTTDYCHVLWDGPPSAAIAASGFRTSHLGNDAAWPRWFVRARHRKEGQLFALISASINRRISRRGSVYRRAHPKLALPIGDARLW
jgi:hypothetical protein